MGGILKKTPILEYKDEPFFSGKSSDKMYYPYEVTNNIIVDNKKFMCHFDINDDLASLEEGLIETFSWYKNNTII